MKGSQAMSFCPFSFSARESTSTGLLKQFEPKRKIHRLRLIEKHSVFKDTSCMYFVGLKEQISCAFMTESGTYSTKAFFFFPSDVH